MDHLLKVLAQHWHLNAAQYVHLRLLSAMSLVPLLATLYLILFGRSHTINSGAGKIKRRITTLTQRSTPQLRAPAAS